MGTATAYAATTTIESLADSMRAGNARLHREVETLLALPGAIADRHDYIRWLGRFYGLYEPLERAFAAFPGWDARGLALPAPSHSALLAHDLAALGADPRALPRASRARLPDLPSFAHALGALYVLEGATLGGRFILRDLDARIGGSIDGARRFFGGRGEAVGPMWRAFRAAVNDFGQEQPHRRDDVAAGAQRCFSAILAWFAPFCAARAELS